MTSNGRCRKTVVAVVVSNVPQRTELMWQYWHVTCNTKLHGPRDAKSEKKCYDFRSKFGSTPSSTQPLSVTEPYLVDLLDFSSVLGMSLFRIDAVGVWFIATQFIFSSGTDKL